MCFSLRGGSGCHSFPGQREELKFLALKKSVKITTALETLIVALNSRTGLLEVTAVVGCDWFQWPWYCSCVCESGKKENENTQR